MFIYLEISFLKWFTYPGRQWGRRISYNFNMLRPSVPYVFQNIFVWCQAITSNNDDLLSIGSKGTNISEIWIKIKQFPSTKMNLKMLSANWWPFHSGLKCINSLTHIPWLNLLKGKFVSHKLPEKNYSNKKQTINVSQLSAEGKNIQARLSYIDWPDTICLNLMTAAWKLLCYEGNGFVSIFHNNACHRKNRKFIRTWNSDWYSHHA